MQLWRLSPMPCLLSGDWRPRKADGVVLVQTQRPKKWESQSQSKSEGLRVRSTTDVRG